MEKDELRGVVGGDPGNAKAPKCAPDDIHMRGHQRLQAGSLQGRQLRNLGGAALSRLAHVDRTA